MAKELILRRGTTAQHSTFTGKSGEVTVDTDKKTVVVHDNITAGGTPLAKESTLTAHTSDTSNPHNVTKTQIGLGSVDNTADSTKNVLSATKLTTARTLQTNLASTVAGSFNGTANITLGVTGVLPVSNGGTGLSTITSGALLKGNATGAMSAAVAGTDYVVPSGSITGNSATATKLATARTITIGNTSKTFDGSDNVSWTLDEIGARITDSVTTTSSVISASATAVKTAYDKAVEASSALSYSAGSNIELQSDSIVDFYGTTPTARKGAIIGLSGTITVSFRLKAYGNHSLYTSYGRIYVNGVARGTLRANATYNWITYTENITINSGDLVQIYTYGGSSTWSDEVDSIDQFRVLVGTRRITRLI